jgi:hypothetical protein
MPDTLENLVGGVEPIELVDDEPGQFHAEHHRPRNYAFAIDDLIGSVMFNREKNVAFYISGLDSAPRSAIGRRPIPRSFFRVIEFDINEDDDEEVHLVRGREVSDDPVTDL